MPVYNHDDLLRSVQGPIQGADITTPPEASEVIADAEEDDSTGFLSASRSFFSVENPVFEVTKELFAPDIDHEFDPEFEPFETLKAERPELLDLADQFVFVKNRAEFDRVALNIDHQLDNRENFAKATTLTKLAAGLAASGADPLILIPYVGAAKVAHAGARIGVGLAKGVALAGAAAVTRESILLASQETRTLSESAINVVAEATFGGIIGAAAGALSSPVKSAARGIYAKALAGEDFKITVGMGKKPTLIVTPKKGAPEMSEFDKLGLAHINERLVKIISGPDWLKAPDLRAILSPSLSIRKLGEVFYNSNYIRNKHVLGEASGDRAQNAISAKENRIISDIKEVEELYTDYTGKGAILSVIARPAGKIKSLEFADRISRNLSDAGRVDAIPQVNQAAAKLRKNMDTRIKELQEVKIIEKEISPEFMSNYLMRIFSLKKLMNPGNEAKLVSTIRSWVKVFKKDATQRARPLSDKQADKIATDYVAKIRGEGDDQVSMRGAVEDVISTGKFSKERKMLIPNAAIMEFIETDALRLYKNYMNTTSKMIETQKALERAGFKNFDEFIDGIRADKAEALKGLDKNSKEATTISKQFKEQEGLADQMYRSMLGQLRKPGRGDRLVEALLNYQFVRLLGGVTISSLPELVMTPFRQGFLKTFKYAYIPMIRSFKTAKLSKDQMNDLTGSLEMEQANVLRSLSGIDEMDNIGRNNTTWDHTQALLVKSFTKASVIGHFTSAGRRIAAQTAASDIVRTLQKGVKGKDVERLASIGIGKEDYAPILKQINAHVQEYKGTNVINPHLWKDQNALGKMQSAIQVEIESAVLKPGIESTPFIVQRNVMAKLMFQFKSFMSASTGKILISGLQRRDANVLAGLISLIAMGTVSGIMHDLIAGREISDDPWEVLLDGVARSGVLGLLMTTILDVGNTFYSEKTRRFGGKNLSSNILGPTGGQIEGLATAIAGLADGDVTNADMRRAARMIPFLNLFYIKAITSRAFED